MADTDVLPASIAAEEFPNAPTEDQQVSDTQSATAPRTALDNEVSDLRISSGVQGVHEKKEYVLASGSQKGSKVSLLNKVYIFIIL
jgi:L-lactate utilization protein LutC